MTRRRIVMFGAAAVAAAAAAVAMFALLPARAPHGSALAPVAGAGARAGIAPTPQTPSPEPRTEIAPLPPAPPDAAPAGGFAESLERAHAGDLHAMTDAGRMLLPCGVAETKARAQKIAMLDRGDDHGAWLAQLGGAAQAREKSLATMRETHARCDAVPPQERERGFAWIEAAAIAGHGPARRLFFARALDGFGDEAAVIANIDEVERRRDVARRLAREDLDACVDGVFGEQAAAFDLLGMTDATDRLAILYADSLSQTDADAAARARLAFDEEAETADAIAVIDGKRRGAALRAHCAR